MTARRLPAVLAFGRYAPLLLAGRGHTPDLSHFRTGGVTPVRYLLDFPNYRHRD